MCPRLPRLTLDRNADVGTTVVMLEVSDADIGQNADIFFRGIRGEFAPEFLQVDENSGEITVTK